MSHLPNGRTFRNSLDANEWTEMEAYELNDIDPEDDERKPEAQALLGEDDEGKESMGAVGHANGEGKDAQDVFSMDEMVARTVPSTDDPSLPSLTFRAILLGSVFCVLGAAASQVFYFSKGATLPCECRITHTKAFSVYPAMTCNRIKVSRIRACPSSLFTLCSLETSSAPSFSIYFVLLTTYPLGHLMAQYVPRKTVFGVDLNPGPFGIIASSGGTSAYASDIGKQVLTAGHTSLCSLPFCLVIVIILRLYYHKAMGPLSSIVLLITTQCTGFGLAGMAQGILVKPVAMYWPSTLVTVQLFTTLHDTQSRMTQKRLRIFLIVGGICFVYQFFPSVFFPTLTSIATLCYVNNNSWLLRTLGSGYNGLGMFNFSLDWSTIGSNGPLYTPWWAQLNYFAGLIGMIWIVVPLLLATNFWQARDFPAPTSAGLFNSTFQHFDVMAVLNDDLSLNDKAWESAKPLLLTPYFSALSYGLNFAALSAVLVHVYIWHREDIVQAVRRRHFHEDIHNKLMQAYDVVPTWWYVATLVINGLAAGCITAISNTTPGLNVLTEWIAGILLPGKPIANVTFKCMGYMSMSQAINLLSDQKLGHYMHVNPKHMFLSQTLGSIIGCFVNYAVLDQVIDAKQSYLDGTLVDPTGQWDGRKPFIFMNASVIWGLISPTRFFAGKYKILYLGFPLGAAVPIACWYLHKRYPNSRINFKKINFAIVCDGASTVPQSPANVIATSFIVAYAANVWLVKRYPDFFKNFIYVVSSALDAGTSLNALTAYAFFSVLFTGMRIPDWWGSSSIDTEHCTPGS
ncbi:hypothetical protein QFC22_004872 [Naganishia vaughanmartiniae]|uniref:Uncharacterized protein n=1 Tax=Naganishia vaughanmartiniae TaxID=1424756 RepID=A0ACC2WZ64_9TREE|nr:hypothetical protein QFC22_004872 [Naganishia vaughanmartiniae]